jgi:nitrogen-specific signal transduction histidine kinase
MKPAPSCILYSRDEELVGRLIRISASIASLQPIDNQEDLERWVAQFGETVLIADLRAPNCLDVLAEIRDANQQTVVIVMGAARSDPMLAAELLRPYATLSFEPDRIEFQAVLKQAVECLILRQKNRVLEEELANLNARAGQPPEPPRQLLSAALQNITKAQRNFDNLELLFSSVVDSLIDIARVSRAGIFMKPQGADHYAYQAGTRCLAATEKLTFPGTEPFVRWLEMNTHLISRASLGHIVDPESRAMLKQMLDAHGAEIILPLYAKGHIRGWIFIGHRATGIPFDAADLEDLTGLADHISTTLEKALQFEETSLQKALAETVLHSIPFGIIACDDRGIIRWFNSMARSILQPLEDVIIGQRLETLGSRIADLMNRTIGEQKGQAGREWTESRTETTIAAETYCLENDGLCVGAMMTLRDVTGARLLKEKEEQLERAAFWNELASSMSHEIRNPLVAIKTFAQLLPERYEEPEFRTDFSQQVTAEVDQLNHIIDKINEFANPPKPVYGPLDIHTPIEHAVTRIQNEFEKDNPKIQLSSDDSKLLIKGDTKSLEECFYHLLMNAAENLGNADDGRITVTVKGSANPGNGSVYVMVSDNGSGIHESVKGKEFSPFSTIKARGLGLGLPIAKRAVIDHNGEMSIDTGPGGTTITLILPATDEVES